MPVIEKRKSILLLLVFFLLTAMFAQASDRDALIALYNSTNGDGWTNNSGWEEPPLDVDGFAMPGTECGWFGVTPGIN